MTKFRSLFTTAAAIIAVVPVASSANFQPKFDEAKYYAAGAKMFACIQKVHSKPQKGTRAELQTVIDHYIDLCGKEHLLQSILWIECIQVTSFSFPMIEMVRAEVIGALGCWDYRKSDIYDTDENSILECHRRDARYIDGHLQ